MRRSAAAVALPALVGLFAILAACTGDGPLLTPVTDDGTSDGGGQQEASAPSLTLEASAPVTIGPGATVTVPVKIVRSNLTAPVKITLAPLPDGIAATPLVIDGAQTTGELSLTATTSVAQTRTTLQLTATAEPSFATSQPLDLVIRGLPGARDVTFGKGGVTIVPSFIPRAVAAGPNDTVIVLGSIHDRMPQVARFTAQGELDKAWGVEGTASFPINEINGDYPRLRVQKDGKILVAGRQSDPTRNRVMRLLPDGNLDTRFGKMGVVDVTTFNDEIIDIAIDPQQRILLVGGVPPVVKRLDADGKADATFDAQGFGTTMTHGTVLVSRDDATAVLMGSHANGAAATTAVTTLDAVNKVPGLQNITYPTASVLGGYVDTNGSYVYVGAGVNATRSDAFLGRTLSRGDADVTFGVGVVKIPSLADGDMFSFTTALSDTDGAILCAGAHVNGAAKGVLLARYDKNGKPDASFGEKGIAEDIETNTQAGDVAGAALQSLSTVVVVRQYDLDSGELRRYWR